MNTYVYAIIKNEKKYLLLKKSDSSKNPGKWNLAGGKLEFGETEKDCVKREVKEETGLDFEPKTALMHHKENGNTFIVFSGNVVIDNISLNYEHEEYGFFYPDKILEMNVFEYINKFFRRLSKHEK